MANTLSLSLAVNQLFRLSMRKAFRIADLKCFLYIITGENGEKKSRRYKVRARQITRNCNIILGPVILCLSPTSLLNHVYGMRLVTTF